MAVLVAVKQSQILIMPLCQLHAHATYREFVAYVGYAHQNTGVAL